MWKKDLCSFCLDCLDVCPNGVLTKKDKTISISSNCVRCGACVDCCSLDALV
ncbi:MAG: 4Fe-4S binding protein [Caldisericia bacterium]|nr:4Fe-4S binding protein [Caldisericia bacterium]